MRDKRTKWAHSVVMKKAHAYLRVSGKGQVEGDGFTRQLKAIREYAAAHDIKIVNVYREEGVGGTRESGCSTVRCGKTTEGFRARAIRARGQKASAMPATERWGRTGRC
jgi:hypothetical protein